MPAWLDQLHREVVACTRCPRLREHCQTVAREKRRAYVEWEYWGKPVPGFGDPNARVLILGLAPGAHGSNRTGRPFTGDSSGNFMYPVLHATGFANQAKATHVGDGLRLTDAYITAAVRCAPPQNKPTPEEIANCAPFLDREIAGLKQVKVVVALGRIGFDAYLNYLKRRGVLKSKKEYAFGHGARYRTPDGRVLLASYHPSNQNTQTGKLTETMFRKIFEQVRELLKREAAGARSQAACSSSQGE
jgi:uracil-DNA glycosylase family 4